MSAEAHHTSLPDPPPPSQPPLQPPFQLQPTSRTTSATPFAMDNAFSDYTQPFQFPSAASTPLNNVWDSPVASSSSTRDGRPRGHSRQSSTSSVPAYVPVNTGRRGSAKDPEALQAALERSKSARKKRTNSTASVLPPDDDEDEQEIASPGDSTSVLRQRQEDARLIRCDAEQQRRNELGKGYDRLRSALNRGDERLSKARVVERATARVVQLRDQNTRMQEELLRKQEIINELNSRANERLMLETSGAAPLLVSSPHSASSPSSGRPDSSSRTSVSAFGVGQAGHTHDRSSSLPTPPHTHTGLQYTGDGTNEFGLGPNHSMYHSKQEPFAYGPFEGGGEDPNLYPVTGGPVPGGDFYGHAPPVIGLNPLTAQQRSESPGSYEPTNAFGLPPGDERHLDGTQGQHWLPAHSNDGIPHWSANSGLPGTFVHQPHNFGSSPSREALGELSEVPASGFPGW